MLLFIRVIFNSCRWCKRFNTSHVTLYLEQNRDCQQFNHVSIHLMLLFIYILFGTLCTTAPVSIHLMLLFISKHFHIYQIFYKFQYISCYSLSCFSRRSVIFHIPFQYISCYSLSGGHFVYFSVYLCFNTSHVTLYLLRREYKKRGAERFNTSHVTLYLVRRPYQKRGQEFQYISCYSLSITPCINKVNRKRFQYISCYSLSLPVIRKELQHQRFNTSHVTLYLVRGLCSYSACRVSIHLMLLFI